MGYVLVYDDGCGPCTRFKRAVEFLDTRKKLVYSGLDEADKSGLLDGIPGPMRHRSFHLLAPDGTAYSGAAALPGLVALLPAGRPVSVVMQVPPVRALIAFAYSTFSRLHDSAACSYSPGSGGRKPGVSVRTGILRP